MAEEIQEYQRIWRNHVEGCFQKVCRGKHIFITLLHDGTLDVQEEDAHTVPSVSERIMTQSLNWQEERDESIHKLKQDSSTKRNKIRRKL
jgi:gas vesicle protein